MSPGEAARAAWLAWQQRRCPVPLGEPFPWDELWPAERAEWEAVAEAAIRAKARERRARSYTINITPGRFP